MLRLLLVAALVLMALGVGAGIAAAQDDTPESEPGLIIVRVMKDSPAAEAGVARSDILLSVNDQAVNSLADLRAILADLEAGDEVELLVLHGDDERTLTAILDEGSGGAYLGIVPFGGAPARAIEMPPMDRLPVPAQPGALIVEIVEDSPASAAGLQNGDTILSVDGTALDRDTDLAGVISGYAPGDVVTLEVARPGEDAREIEITLGENPDRDGVAYLGVSYRPGGFMNMGRGFWQDELPFGRMMPFDPEESEAQPDAAPDGQPFGRGFRFQMPDAVQEGAIIRSVAEDSPAAAAGLAAGDVITAIDGEAVARPSDLAKAIADHQPGDTLTLTVQRPDQEEAQEIEVTLAGQPDQPDAAYLGVSIGGYYRIQGMEDVQPFMPRVNPDQPGSGNQQPGRPFQDFLQRVLPFNLEDLDLKELEELIPFDFSAPGFPAPGGNQAPAGESL